MKGLRLKNHAMKSCLGNVRRATNDLARRTVRRVWIVGFILIAVCLAPVIDDMAAGNGEARAADDLKKRLDGLSPEEQIDLLTRIRAEGHGDARVSFYLGNTHLGLDSPDTAVVYYREAIAEDSTFTKAYVNLGIALERINRLGQARLNYQKAIDLDPEDVLAHCHLGHSYHVRGRLGEAVDHYRRALEIDPQSAQAHYNMGIASADSRLFAEAAREWEKVVELDPESELGRTAAENVELIKTYIRIGRAKSDD